MEQAGGMEAFIWQTIRSFTLGQGFVINVGATKDLTIGGNQVSCVKSGPTIVAVYGPGIVNIVGLVNPLVGTNAQLGSIGLKAFMGAFSDPVDLRSAGTLTSLGTFLYDGSVMRDGSFQNADSTPVALTQGFVLNVGTNKEYVQPSQYQ